MRKKKCQHKFKLAQVVKDSNFELSMCGIYQDKGYVICEKCGFIKYQWINDTVEIKK